MVGMINVWMKLVKGDLLWKYLRLRYAINDTTVVLFLAGENPKIDEYALKYLGLVMERKVCNRVVIFVENEELFCFAKGKLNSSTNADVRKITTAQIMAVYNWYRVVRFNKNLFFTFTDRTKDNLLGKFIRETEINEKDAVCLAIFNFRKVVEE